MPETKTALELLEEIKADAATYREANDALIEAKADGKAFGELKVVVDKIEKVLQSTEAHMDRLTKVEVAIRRGNLAAGGGDEIEATEKAERKEFSKLFIQALRKGSVRSTTRVVGHLDEKQDARLVELEKKFLAVQSNPDGGYWVSPDQTGRMVKRIFETSPMRQVAAAQTISTDALEGVVDAQEAGFEWVGETVAPAADSTTPQIGKWRIPVFEMATRPKATQQLLDDAIVNVEQWLAGKVTSKFARQENNAFVLGNGVNKPKGFLTYPSTTGDDLELYERGNIAQLTSANVAAVAFDDLIQLLAALKAEYEINATWAMNRRTKSEVRQLKDDEGRYLWQPSVQVGDPATILGRPLVMFEDMPDVATDAKAIAVGDFNAGYQIVDRSGISVLRDPFTIKPFVEFYTRKRVGGAVVDFDALRILIIQ